MNTQTTNTTNPSKRKKALKYIGIAIFPALALVLMGASSASAHGMFGFGGMNNLTPDQIVTNQQSKFQEQANLLGISVDEVKNAWASGKSMQTLATEKGLTKEQLQQKMQDLRKQQVSAQIKVLVDKGVITQAQADQRLASIEKMQANKKAGKGFGHGKGMMQNQ
jgi:hypothetical protein